MRFMMIMIPGVYHEPLPPDFMPDPEAVKRMGKFNEELQEAGVLLTLDGLTPPSASARVSFAHGKPKVIDGPFAEAKEVIGGYWMIQVRSREEAIWRIEAARLVAGLARLMRDVALAEDLAQDAPVSALDPWPQQGIPDRPGAWPMAVTRRRAVDVFRRDRPAAQKHQELAYSIETMRKEPDPDAALACGVAKGVNPVMSTAKG